MTAIYIDPTELHAKAQLYGPLAKAIGDTVSGVSTSCSCHVPANLQGYLAAELEQIEIGGLKAAIGIVHATIDIKQRANKISADQAEAARVAGVLVGLVAALRGSPAGGSVTPMSTSRATGITGGFTRKYDPVAHIGQMQAIKQLSGIQTSMSSTVSAGILGGGLRGSTSGMLTASGKPYSASFKDPVTGRYT